MNFFFYNPAPYSLGDEFKLIHLYCPYQRPPGCSPLGTAGHLHVFDLLSCLPVVCVCVCVGGRGLQLVQNLQMKPQVITCTFSGDLFTSNGSKHFFFIYLNATSRSLPLGTPFVTSPSCLPVGGGTVGSESSDEASSHKVQFFKGVVHFQW